jgi:replicative DNA helicase
MFDHSAEQTVLGGILMDGSILHEVENILPHKECFNKDYHQNVYEATLILFHSQEPTDMATVAQKMQALGYDPNPYKLSKIFESTPSAETAIYSAKTVQEHWRKRTLRPILQTGLQRTEHDPVDEIIPDIVQSLDDLNASAADDVVLFEQALADGAARIEKFQHGYPGYTCGISQLDKYLQGWEHGDYMILPANSSNGKTSIACDLTLRFASQDIPVLIISLETEAARLASRMLVNHAETPLRGFVGKPDYSSIADYPIYIRDAARITNYRSFVQRMVHKYNIEIVFIDHMQIFTTGDTESRAIGLDEISQDIKATTKDLNLITVALSQVTGCEGYVPGKEHIRWNKDIAHHADKVFSIAHAAKLKTPGKQKLMFPPFNGESVAEAIPDLEKTTIVNVDKNRDGPVGKFLITSDLALFKYGDYDV